MAAPQLDSLNIELIHEIAQFLDFRSQCDLRLSSSQLSKKMADCLLFQSHFASKTISLDGRSLENFHEMSERSWLLCQVQHLTLSVEPQNFYITDKDGDVHMAGAGDTSINFPRSLQPNNQLLQHAKWLTYAFLNISKKAKPTHRIWIYISLDLSSQGGRTDWVLVWQSASWAFRVVIQAIVTSKIRVYGLDTFTTVRRCSLAVDQLSTALQALQLPGNVPKHLRSLGLSLSHSLESSISPYGGSPEASGQYVALIAAFLSFFASDLESLHLHWYKITYKKTPARIIEHQFFDCLADTLSFVSLRKCILQGIYTSQESLPIFLRKATQLQSLELDSVYLMDRGSFRDAFDCMVQLGRLEYLRLYSLSESSLISFRLTDGSESIELICQAPSFYFPILYRTQTFADCIDTPASRRWRRREALDFGPIDTGYG